MTGALRAAKDLLRERVAASLRALPGGEAARLGRLAAGRLAGLDEFRAARRVLLYAALPDEVDTRGLFETVLASGRELYLPVCHPELCDMDAVRVADPARDLVRRHFGILAPRRGLPKRDPAEMDLVVIPGRAFDRSGRRLGRGWGTYDHFLARAGERPVRAGLALGIQLVAEVPAGRYDQRVGLVVTELEVLRPTAG
jgi:5-formyltetrahydrofolate cyclo-ligase